MNIPNNMRSLSVSINKLNIGRAGRRMADEAVLDAIHDGASAREVFWIIASTSAGHPCAGMTAVEDLTAHADDIICAFVLERLLESGADWVDAHLIDDICAMCTYDAASHLPLIEVSRTVDELVYARIVDSLSTIYNVAAPTVLDLILTSENAAGRKFGYANQICARDDAFRRKGALTDAMAADMRLIGLLA